MVEVDAAHWPIVNLCVSVPLWRRWPLRSPCKNRHKWPTSPPVYTADAVAPRQPRVEDAMRKSGVLAGLVLLGAAAGALAQDPQPSASPEPQEEARPEPVKKIKVLQDPHDIASFYRSNQQPYGGWFGDYSEAPLGKVSENPYAIAGYYRNHQHSPYGYSQFWTSGYGGS